MALRFIQWNRILLRVKPGEAERKSRGRCSVCLSCKGTRARRTCSGWFFHPARSTLPLVPAPLFTNSITSVLPSDSPRCRLLPRETPAGRRLLPRLALGTKGSSLPLAFQPRAASAIVGQWSCVTLGSRSAGHSETPLPAAKNEIWRGKMEF